jgi:dsRNA-specific ribonuclease
VEAENGMSACSPGLLDLLVKEIADELFVPLQPENLEGSGLTVVLNTTLFAIIGAISLQHGAEVAQQVVREKILRRLGA